MRASRGTSRRWRMRTRTARRRAMAKTKATGESGGPWFRQRRTNAVRASWATSSARRGSPVRALQ